MIVGRDLGPEELHPWPEALPPKRRRNDNASTPSCTLAKTYSAIYLLDDLQHHSRVPSISKDGGDGGKSRPRGPREAVCRYIESLIYV